MRIANVIMGGIVIGLLLGMACNALGSGIGGEKLLVLPYLLAAGVALDQLIEILGEQNVSSK